MLNEKKRSEAPDKSAGPDSLRVRKLEGCGIIIVSV